MRESIKNIGYKRGIMSEKDDCRFLADYQFHSFRHFFNTRLVANGVNGELVRATVGHESKDMTKHYLHLVPSDLNIVMDVATQKLH